MLEYKLLDHKPNLKKDGEQYVDLLAKSFNETATASFNPIIVNKHYVARPDLISLVTYGDDKYADIICKLNGISNPFELNEDMVILLPNIEYLNDCVIRTTTPSQIIEDPKKDTIQLVDKYNMQKRKDESRSPNQQVVGDSNFIIDKSLGVVFY